MSTAPFLDDVAWHARRRGALRTWASVLLALAIPALARAAYAASAVRGASDQTDPWGPMDAVVLLLGMGCAVAAGTMFAAAAQHDRAVAAIARWQIRDADGARVSLRDAHAALRRRGGLQRWARRHGSSIIAVDDLTLSGRAAQLFVAATARPGSRGDRRAQFGAEVAARYDRIQRTYRILLVVLCALPVVACAITVVGYTEAHAASPLFRIGIAALLTCLVLCPVTGFAVARKLPGPRQLAAELISDMHVRDPSLDIPQVVAMLRRPRLHEMWAARPPIGCEPPAPD